MYKYQVKYFLGFQSHQLLHKRRQTDVLSYNSKWFRVWTQPDANVVFRKLTTTFQHQSGLA